MESLGHCQVCGSDELTSFYVVRDVPVQSTVLLDSRVEALQFPTGQIDLALCSLCGFVQNGLFDPGSIDYSLPTEESQAFSPLFLEYATGLADRLVEEHGLVGGRVLEVGSGKGEFLAMLADRGIARGVGVDPGFLPSRGPGEQANLEFRREFFGPDSDELSGDLVLARHLLEHVSDVHQFLGLLARSTSRTSGARLVIEVPDARRIFVEGAFWDVYYEHCSYFTVDSMGAALRGAGMSVDRVESVFGSQYLLALARPGGGDERRPGSAGRGPAELASLTGAFASAAGEAIAIWRERISDQVDAGREVVMWGASSKAVAFLSSIGLTDVTMVDINPHKQGKWLPGSAVQVVGPDDLAGTAPGLVIPMNPIYVEEIEADLRRLGLAPEVIAVG